jgi:hypothetical protein
MKTVYYDNGSQFELTDEEFEKALMAFNSGKSVYVNRIEAHLSPYYKWAGKKPDDQNRGRLHDGTRVIKQFGQWVQEDDPKVKLDITYYPEIVKDQVMRESEWQDKIKLLK